MSKAPSTGTLNSKVRIDELTRVWGENQKILHKITSIKTHYPVKKLKSNASL
jgi:hypothetical protein